VRYITLALMTIDWNVTWEKLRSEGWKKPKSCMLQSMEMDTWTTLKASRSLQVPVPCASLQRVALTHWNYCCSLNAIRILFQKRQQLNFSNQTWYWRFSQSWILRLQEVTHLGRWTGTNISGWIAATFLRVDGGRTFRRSMGFVVGKVVFSQSVSVFLYQHHHTVLQSDICHSSATAAV
jgi:hypothetical protein